MSDYYNKPSYSIVPMNTIYAGQGQGQGPDRNQPPKRPNRKKKKSGGKIAVIALCCSLVGGAVGAGAVALGSGIISNPKATATATVLEGQRDADTVGVSYVDTGSEMTAAEIYEANVNSTVGITTSINTNYFGFQTTAAASGSGFILTEDGYIVTNYHVIEGASSVKVTTYDNTSYDATIVGYDEANDLAVLKIDAEGLTPVVLGDSDQMSVGDEVLAIGNPLGELTFSLTSGSISALDREVTISNLPMNLIQTDCAINSGNSGGALFNMYGEVIGITNAKYSNNGATGQAAIDNIAFAIPINSVKDIITSIIETGYISKPYIGITAGDLSEEYQGFGLPQGAAVQSVSEGSPAQAAGLQANDIITAVNGETITSFSELKKIISESEIGATLKLTVYRQGESIELNVTVAEQKQAAIQENTATEQQQGMNENSESGSIPWEYFFGR